MVDQIKMKLKPSLVLAFLFAATIAITLLTGAASYLPTMPVREQLPEKVAQWQGVEILFCQEPSCSRSFDKTQLEGKDVCLICGGKLASISPAEVGSLPKDSIVLRKRYKDGSDNWISVAVVISGQERSSIHRPEWCLPGQGLRIAGSGTAEVELLDERRMPINVLDVSLSSSDPSKPPPMAYAYWFHSIKHDTASQIERLGWMAWDNIIHGTTYRWAYIMIIAPNSASGGRDAMFADFIPEFWERFAVRE